MSDLDGKGNAQGQALSSPGGTGNGASQGQAQSSPGGKGNGASQGQALSSLGSNGNGAAQGQALSSPGGKGNGAAQGQAQSSPGGKGNGASQGQAQSSPGGTGNGAAQGQGQSSPGGTGNGASQGQAQSSPGSNGNGAAQANAQGLSIAIANGARSNTSNRGSLDPSKIQALRKAFATERDLVKISNDGHAIALMMLLMIRYMQRADVPTDLNLRDEAMVKQYLGFKNVMSNTVVTRLRKELASLGIEYPKWLHERINNTSSGSREAQKSFFSKLWQRTTGNSRLSNPVQTNKIPPEAQVKIAQNLKQQVENKPQSVNSNPIQTNQIPPEALDNIKAELKKYLQQTGK